MMPGGVGEDSSTVHTAPPGEETPAAQLDATPSAAAPLATGSRVRIAGISSRPELNGQFAVCLRHMPEKGRWLVRLEGDAAEELSIKEPALTPSAAAPPSDQDDDNAAPPEEVSVSRGGAQW